MSFSKSVKDKERDKFKETSDQETAVRTIETYEGDGTPGSTSITHDFQLDIDVPKDVSVNHDITITDGQIAEIHQFNINASGLAEFELQIGDGAAAETFTTKELVDTADVNIYIIPYQRPIIILGTPSGRTIRVIKTNLANQAQDLSSKLILVIK